MAEAAQHDIGEVWGKVENLEANIRDVGAMVTRGLRDLSEQISKSNDRLDGRINEVQTRSDARFEAIQQQTLAQLSGRSSQQWQIFAYIGSIIVGLAAVGATFWQLTKAPIDAAFARQDAVSSSIVAVVSKLSDKLDDKYVQRTEILSSQGSVKEELKTDTARIDAIERENATSIADRAAIRVELVSLHVDLKDLAKSVVPRPENENRFLDIQYRIDKLFDRLNITQDNLDNGNHVGDRINRLSNQLETLTDKFINVPPVVVQPAAPK